MPEAFKEFMLRRDLIAVAVGLTMALATFYLVEAVVADLITPLISIFVGDLSFETNAFTISASEFRYGALIEAAITFAFVSGAAYFLLTASYRHPQDRGGVTSETRACPECTSSISAVAKRCPRCTAVVEPSA